MKRRDPSKPTDYTPEIGQEIARRIINGESVRRICASRHMPEKWRVFDWLATLDHPFFDLYARAREASAETNADEIEDVKEDVRQGRLDPNAGRVVIDALKWSAGQKKPHKYGKALTLRGEGEGGAIPVRMEALSDAQLDSFIARLQRSQDADALSGAGREEPTQEDREE